MPQNAKCAHPGCNCIPPAGKDYCSPACANAAGSLEGSCQCGHPGCVNRSGRGPPTRGCLAGFLIEVLQRTLVEGEVKLKMLVPMVACALLLGCRTNESPEAQVNDLQITAQVKAKLASDVGVDSVTNISVNSTNGVVTLAGQVDSPDARTKAEAVAKSVPKVTKVVDTLQVAPTPH